MDPGFVREVIQNQAPMPKERIYTIEDIRAANGELRGGVSAVLMNSYTPEQEVVTVRVVSRGAGDKVCGHEDINLDTDVLSESNKCAEQANLRAASRETNRPYTTCTYDWEVLRSGVDWSSALDKITLTKSGNIVRVEDCKSRLGGSKSTVYFMKLLEYIIKTSGHDSQYVYVLPYIYIRPSSSNITLTVDSGPMEELHQTMKWICLTFRPPTGLPCFSYGSHASDGNIFTLKPLSPLTNRTIIEFCQELFGNAVIACEQNTGVPQVRFFYLNMAFGDLKARTGCNRLRDFHGGILFEGTHGTLIPLRYSAGTKDIIWRFHKGQVEQCENTRVLNCIAELPDWPGRDLKDPNRQATELIDEKRVLVCKYRPHTS